MKPEIEAKFLNVDHAALREQLKSMKAVLIQPMRLMRRANFDYPDRRLQKIGGWVRVRDEGDKITLSYKQLNDRSLHGTEEVNLTVNDFDTSRSFLKSIGLEQKTYQETRRESWQLDGVEVELDQWPWVRPFVELESSDGAAVRRVAERLGFDWEQALYGSVETVYQSEYDISEDEVDDIDDLVFKLIPVWLAERSKIASRTDHEVSRATP